MRVLHIIPSAFDYFNDIRSSAFSLIEDLNTFGVAVEALTIQYEEPSKGVESEIKTAAPSREYQGTIGMVEVAKTLAEFDIIHLHAPGFGAVGKVLMWKKQFLQLPLVVTVHGRFPVSDLFSVVVKAYNWYYLPRVFRVAEAMVCSSVADFKAYYRLSFSRYRQKLWEIDENAEWLGEDLTKDPDLVQLTPRERLAFKYVTVYNDLVKNP